MKKEHKFLYRLYKETNGRRNRKTLVNATPAQIWLVVRLLFCIAVGHIPLTFKNYQRLVQSRRRNSLKNLKNNMPFLQYGKSKLKKRQKFVMQFAVLYHYLFHDIFVEK